MADKGRRGEDSDSGWSLAGPPQANLGWPPGQIVPEPLDSSCSFLALGKVSLPQEGNPRAWGWGLGSG